MSPTGLEPWSVTEVPAPSTNVTQNVTNWIIPNHLSKMLSTSSDREQEQEESMFGVRDPDKMVNKKQAFF